MSHDLTSLFLALGIFAVGFISVGPNILAIIGTSMQRGRAEGTALALGVATGTAIWATLTVTGLTALVTAYAGAVTALKVLGALYLLWLAYKSFRSAARRDVEVAAESVRGGNLYLRGLTVQMTNPKAALHWIAIVGVGIGSEAPLWVGLTLVVSATALSILAHVAYAVAFSTSPVISFYRRARRWIEAGLGVFFGFAAFKIATFRN
ncbi:MAG: LysE family translocator [Paracoccaceae bacterium]